MVTKYIHVAANGIVSFKEVILKDVEAFPGGPVVRTPHFHC